MSVKVRRMTAADVKAVALIDAMSLPVPWSEHTYRYELTAPHSRPWVAEVVLPVEGEPLTYHSALGELVCQPGQLAEVGILVLWKIVDEAHIATLAVHPQCRRKGIAKLLLEIALRDAAAEGAEKAFLEVRQGNLAAQNLYRQFGFEVAGRRSGYYRDNHEDALLMNLDDLQHFQALVGSKE